jgi:hypothetical protein
LGSERVAAVSLASQRPSHVRHDLDRMFAQRFNDNPGAFQQLN